MSDTVFDALGIRPVINAAATLTKLGGSVMPAPVIEAMNAASRSFIDLFELHDRVGERLAALTHNEAAVVTSGAAGGIALTTVACILGSEADTRQMLPQMEGVTRKEVIVFAGQESGYEYAAQQTGATMVSIGPTEADLLAALNENTALVLFLPKSVWADAAPPLQVVVRMAHEHGVPVIVDAAAQIPPISNLWHFTVECGADAAIFSGGKALRGPQPSGLVVGRQWIIDGCRNHASPYQGFGRPMKVGKEEIAGLLAAVDWSLKQDEPANIARYEEVVRQWIADLSGLPGVTVERSFPSEAGQPHARAILTLDSSAAMGRDVLVDGLWNLNPRIAVSPIDGDAIALNPQTLEIGEDVLVTEAITRLLGARK